jgi:hypothetical protein
MKRLFFLATSVKLKFSKTFCLPYFDDCSSLCIYSYLQLLGLSSLQYRIFLKLSIFFYDLKQHNSPANLYLLLTSQRREVCYTLRNPIQLVKPLSSNKHTDLKIDNVFINWYNVTRIYDFKISFTEFKALIYQ